MPLEELMKLYNYGRPAPAENNETDDAGSGKKDGQERLRDVRPEKNRHDKNGVNEGKTKSGEVRNMLSWMMQEVYRHLKSTLKLCVYCD